jgi:hypothetical protein
MNHKGHKEHQVKKKEVRATNTPSRSGFNIPLPVPHRDGERYSKTTSNYFVFFVPFVVQFFIPLCLRALA